MEANRPDKPGSKTSQQQPWQTLSQSGYVKQRLVSGRACIFACGSARCRPESPGWRPMEGNSWHRQVASRLSGAPWRLSWLQTYKEGAVDGGSGKCINLTKLLLPSFLLTAQGKEKTLYGHFIREVISIYLYKATEEPMHSMVMYLQFESFI